MRSKPNKFEALAEEGQLGNHPELVEEVVEYLGLSIYWALFERILADERSGESADQMNLFARLVVMNTYQLLMYNNLKKELVEPLMVAAIFAGFSPNTPYNTTSIQKATDNFNLCQMLLRGEKQYYRLSDKEGFTVRGYIRSTRKPHAFLKNSQIPHRILRDAVNLSWLYGDEQRRADHLFWLSGEAYPLQHKLHRVHQKLAFEEFVQQYSKDVTLVQWFTNFAYNLAFKENWVLLQKQAIERLRTNLPHNKETVEPNIGDMVCGHSLDTPLQESSLEAV